MYSPEPIQALICLHHIQPRVCIPGMFHLLCLSAPLQSTGPPSSNPTRLGISVHACADRSVRVAESALGTGAVFNVQSMRLKLTQSERKKRSHLVVYKLPHCASADIELSNRTVICLTDYGQCVPVSMCIIPQGTVIPSDLLCIARAPSVFQFSSLSSFIFFKVPTENVDEVCRNDGTFIAEI